MTKRKGLAQAIDFGPFCFEKKIGLMV